MNELTQLKQECAVCGVEGAGEEVRGYPSTGYMRSDDGTIFAELRSCVKVEVAVLGSPSLISLTVCVDVKQHERKSGNTFFVVVVVVVV